MENFYLPCFNFRNVYDGYLNLMGKNSSFDCGLPTKAAKVELPYQFVLIERSGYETNP